jgi:hypothetical protein
MAAKTFSVKLSNIAKEIDKASSQLGKIRKHLSPKDKKRADVHVKKLKSAKALVSAGCSGKKMTAMYMGPDA